MVATVPSGDGATWPYSLSMASACQRMQAAVSGMSSPTVSVIGLPASMVSISPSSRALPSIRSAHACSTRFRAPGSIRDQTPRSKAERAAATAASTSATPPSATSVMGWPVAGFSVVNRRPSRAGRKSPSMKRSVRRRKPASSDAASSRSGIRVSVIRASPRACEQLVVTGDHGTAAMVLATQSQPNRNVVASGEARLWKPTPASVWNGHMPQVRAARAAGRSV